VPLVDSAKLSDATALAVDRTRLAHERTLMAWIRTATSMISFGFTIYKFFQYRQEKEGILLSQHLFGPRGFAMLIIAMGLVSLFLATIAHHREMKMLEQQYGKMPRSFASLIAALTSGFGLLVFIAVIFRQ
jgi:putative membrane protein